HAGPAQIRGDLFDRLRGARLAAPGKRFETEADPRRQRARRPQAEPIGAFAKPGAQEHQILDRPCQSAKAIEGWGEGLDSGQAEGAEAALVAGDAAMGR